MKAMVSVNSRARAVLGSRLPAPRRVPSARVRYQDPKSEEQRFKKGVESNVDKVKGAADDKAGQAKGKFEETKGSAQGKYEETKGNVQGKFENAKGEAQGKFENAKGEAQSKFEDAKGAAREGAQQVQASAHETAKHLNWATIGYLATAAATLAMAAFKLLRPEAALAASFTDALAARGAEIAAFTNAAASSSLLVQISAALSVPIAAASICLARASSSGNLDSDSSMRFNYGLMAYASTLLFTYVISPLKSTLSGAAGRTVFGYLTLLTVTLFLGARGSRRFTSLAQMSRDMTRGGIATTLRTLTPRTLPGSIYGIFAAAAALAAAALTFAPESLAHHFHRTIAEAAVSSAHTDLIRFVSGGIAASLVFATVAFAALKELADKSGLATSTARLMNMAFSASLAAFVTLLSKGASNGMVAGQSVGMHNLLSQVSAAMLVLSLILSVFPTSKSHMKEDTAADSY